MELRHVNKTCILIVLALAGCATGQFNVKKHTPGAASNGIVYALPRTVVTVSIPYKVKASLRLVQGEYLKKARAELGEVNVITSVEPDPDNYFEIDTSLTDSSTWKNTFSATLNENMTLAKSSVTTEDTTLGAFKDVLSLLVGVNSLLERAEDDVDPTAAWKELQKLVAVQKKAREAMSKLLEGELARVPSSDQQKLAEARRDFFEKALVYTKSRIGELKVRKPREISVIILCTLDLAKPTSAINIDKATCPRMKEAYEKIEALSDGTMQGLVPSFSLRLDGTPAVPAAATIAPGGESVYVYRIPYIGGYKLTASIAGKNPILSEGPITIAQIGTYGRVYVKGTRFAKHTSELELHANTGGLKTYKSVRESSATSSAATGLRDIATLAKDATAKPTELEALESENKSLEAQIKNVEFQRKLAELLADENID